MLDSPLLATTTGFTELLRLYYGTMIKQPEFPKLKGHLPAAGLKPGD